MSIIYLHILHGLIMNLYLRYNASSLCRADSLQLPLPHMLSYYSYYNVVNVIKILFVFMYNYITVSQQTPKLIHRYGLCLHGKVGYIRAVAHLYLNMLNIGKQTTSQR